MDPWGKVKHASFNGWVRGWDKTRFVSAKRELGQDNLAVRVVLLLIELLQIGENPRMVRWCVIVWPRIASHIWGRVSALYKVARPIQFRLNLHLNRQIIAQYGCPTGWFIRLKVIDHRILTTLPTFREIFIGVQHILGITSMSHGHIYLLRVMNAKTRNLSRAQLSYLVHILDTLAYQRFFKTEWIRVGSISFKTCPVSILLKIFVIARLIRSDHLVLIAILRNMVRKAKG